jgi:hypothetical protein
MVVGLDFHRFVMMDAAASAPTVLGEKLDECFVDGLHLSEYVSPHSFSSTPPSTSK